DVSVSLTDAPDPVDLGQNITYSVTVNNQGPDGATGVTTQDVLDNDLGFVSASSGCSYDTPSRQVTCSFGNLGPNGSASKVTTVSTEQAGTVPNSVSVSANESDPVSSNNSASVNTTVNSVPGTSDLAITQSGPPAVVPTSQNITYHLDATND